MKYVLLAVAALALGGCATAPTEVKIPENVYIQVPIPCKTPDPAVPQYRFNPPYDNTFEGARDLLGDREQALAYEAELRTALKSCR